MEVKTERNISSSALSPFRQGEAPAIPQVNSSPLRHSGPLNLKQGEKLTLRKSAKLRHRSLVEGLFDKGKSIYEFPLRMTWRMLDGGTLRSSFRDEVPQLVGPLQMLVTVPKKKRRHAVDRVLMRRRIREAFRLHSRTLRTRIETDPGIRTVSLAFIYLHTENESYADIEKRMVRLLAKLERRLWPSAPISSVATTSEPLFPGKDEARGEPLTPSSGKEGEV